MKNSNFWTYYIVLFVILLSCRNSEGDWGATVGDCDEICTIYNSVQIELMKFRKLNDRNFPKEEERKKHVVEIKNGHKVESWFRVIDEANDTVIKQFSCEVFYNTEIIGYVVKNLKIEN